MENASVICRLSWPEIVFINVDLSLKRAYAASDYELKPAVNSTSSVGHKYVFVTV